jgi:spermidine/putrescine transport system ATP-binding protein
MPPDVHRRVKVGVRPEKISIHRNGEGSASGANSVTGLLRMSTYIGVSHQYKVVGPGEADITVYAQNLGHEATPTPGERVVLSWKPEHTFAVVPQDDLELELDEGEI